MGRRCTSSLIPTPGAVLQQSHINLTRSATLSSGKAQHKCTQKVYLIVLNGWSLSSNLCNVKRQDSKLVDVQELCINLRQNFMFGLSISPSRFPKPGNLCSIWKGAAPCPGHGIWLVVPPHGALWLECYETSIYWVAGDVSFAFGFATSQIRTRVYGKRCLACLNQEQW